MKKGGTGVLVSQLDGYLQAVRDMNDDHSGKRYFFWADLLSFNKENTATIIKKYLKCKCVKINEIGLKEELEIIESYILDNYLQGASSPDNKEQNYIKKLHGWRIQEIISLATDYEKADGRWAAEIDHENGKRTSVFIKIKQKLIVINFLKQNKII